MAEQSTTYDVDDLNKILAKVGGRGWEEDRKPLLKALRLVGIDEVIIEYSGYGDSGHVEGVTLNRKGSEYVWPPKPLETKLSDWGWDLAYSQNQGFENNDGGEGTVTWDVTKDKILLNHGDHYTETRWEETEL